MVPAVTCVVWSILQMLGVYVGKYCHVLNDGKTESTGFFDGG